MLIDLILFEYLLKENGSSQSKYIYGVGKVGVPTKIHFEFIGYYNSVKVKFSRPDTIPVSITV